MQLSKEDLTFLAAALEQHDLYLSNLTRSIPNLATSGTLDEARGKSFLLLSRIKREIARPTAPAE